MRLARFNPCTNDGQRQRRITLALTTHDLQRVAAELPGRRCLDLRVKGNRYAAPGHVFDRLHVVAARQEQSPRADRCRFGHTENAARQKLLGQRAAQRLERDQVGGQVVERDHARGFQQQRQQLFLALFVGGRKTHCRRCARPGECRDDAAQVALAAGNLRGFDVEHRRGWQARTDGGGQDASQGCSLIGGAGERELGQQGAKLSQGLQRLLACRLCRHIKQARIKHTEQARRRIKTSLSHQTAIGAQVRLACDAGQGWQVLVTLAVEQNLHMARRRVAGDKILSPRVVTQPGRAARQRSNQCRLRHRFDRGRAAFGGGVDRHNQTATLVVTGAFSQHGLGSVNDAMQLARFDLDRRAVLCSLKRHAQELQQSANAVFVAVAVLALEPAHRVQVGRLKICAAMVVLVGMLMQPRTRNVVFAAAQWLLIKPAFFQRCNDLVFVGAGHINAVCIAVDCSSFAARCFLARFNRWCQFQALDNLVNGVAPVGVELNQLALERGVGLAIAGERQTAPAGRW